ncbi:EndoU nuclease [Tenacibaculum sp. MAR_2010_89]|uniref:EndoU domain-containing protein n=1 Tax=Tenacibaculum sp. MAR_2010_89 TaxID=1250198 RepID=UPI00089729D0|nr:EndoU domain-containing protein [Tenacibaculum sp. MAR_2010_89]SEE16780.1 EndoU nuclease [Tenacibaculum sp. MAR_2010_89]
MNTKKRTFKLLLTFCLLAFTFYSCQNEDDIVLQNTQKNTKPIIESLSLKEAQNKSDFIELANTFKANKVYQKKHGHAKSDKHAHSNNEFTINTENFNRVEIGEYVSYTFSIQRELKEKRAFENLVIEKKNGKIRGYILKYNKVHYVQNGENLVFKAKISKSPYFNDVESLLERIKNPLQFKMANPDCGWETSATLRFCNTHGVYNSANGKCANYGKDNWNYSRTYVCGTGSSGNSGTDIGTSGGSTNTGGSGNSYSPDNNTTSSTSAVVNTIPVKGFTRINSIDDALKNVPSRMTTVETQYAYLRNVGYFLQGSNSFKELGSSLVNLSLEATTINSGEASEMVKKTVEIINILKNKNTTNFESLSFFEQNIVVQNSLFINFLPSLKSLGIELPKTVEEWKAFGQIIVSVLKEMIPELIPGVSELKSFVTAVSDFKKGSYTSGTTELAFAIIGIIPAGKVMKALLKFGKLIKKVAKVFKIAYKYVGNLGKALAKGFKTSINGNTLKLLDKSDGVIVSGKDAVESFVKSSKKLDDLGDKAFEQLRKDPDFIKSFNKVETNTKLNDHTFKGDITITGKNAAGQNIYTVTGIHSNKAFSNGTARIKPGTQIENLGDGFYKAKVEKQINGFTNAQGTNWKVKKTKSTFFPNNWSTEKIQAEIAYSFKNKKLINGNKYNGFTTTGHKITIFLDDLGNIKTAFPNL